VLGACNASYLMMACRPVGAANFTLLAWGAASAVTTDTGTSNTVTTTNGVGFYFE
jgi:hypothetical protein